MGVPAGLPGANTSGGGFKDWWKDNIQDTGVGGFLSGLFDTGANYAAAQDVMDRLSKVGGTLAKSFPEIGEEAFEKSQFKPFTVTSGTGTTSALVDPETGEFSGVSNTLSGPAAAQQQGIQNIISGMLGGGGTGRPAPYANAFGISGPQRPSMANPAGSIGGMIPTPPLSSRFNNVTPERLQKAEEERRKYLERNNGVDKHNLANDIYNFMSKQPGDIGYTTFGPVVPEFLKKKTKPPSNQIDSGSIVTQVTRGGQPVQPPTQPMFTSATPTSISDQAFGGVGGLLSAVTGDRGSREQQIYDRIRATQTPEEDRQRQLLNDQLLSQGRLGLSTAMFGGSPEQFAQEKARAEAMNQASLAAMGQAGQERAQDLATATGLFGLGSQGSMLPYQLQGMQGQNLAQMMGLQYMPEQMMLEQLGAGTNVASIADMGRRYGAGLFDESAGSGLEALMNTELAKADFLKSIYANALGGGGTEGGGSWFGDIISGIFEGV